MMPILTGQPLRIAEAVHFSLAHERPPVAHEAESEAQPLALSAYRRLLPNVSRLPSTPSEAVLTFEALIPPSLP